MKLDANGDLYESINWPVTKPEKAWDNHSYIVAMKPTLVNGEEIHFVFS